MQMCMQNPESFDRGNPGSKPMIVEFPHRDQSGAQAGKKSKDQIALEIQSSQVLNLTTRNVT